MDNHLGGVQGGSPWPSLANQSSAPPHKDSIMEELRKLLDLAMPEAQV